MAHQSVTGKFSSLALSLLSLVYCLCISVSSCLSLPTYPSHWRGLWWDHHCEADALTFHICQLSGPLDFFSFMLNENYKLFFQVFVRKINLYLMIITILIKITTIITTTTIRNWKEKKTNSEKLIEEPLEKPCLSWSCWQLCHLFS